MGAESSRRPSADSTGRGRAGAGLVARYMMQVLWPAFLGAVIAVGVFFSAIDPLQLDLAGVRLASSRTGAYTAGFFVFWILFALSGTITWWLARTD